MSHLTKLIWILLIYVAGLSAAYAAPTLNFVFKGIQGDVLNNAQERLTIFEKSYGELTPDKIQAIYEQAAQEVSHAMQPYGYFRANIQSHLSHNHSTWTISFTIQPNEAIKISQLAINVIGPGKDDREINALLNHFPLKVGDVFRTDAYEKAKESVFQAANNRGYVKAVFSLNNLFIDINHYQVKVNLVLQTGPRFYFGKVSFQPSPYSQDFLNRFISFNENTPFSSKKLLELQQAISKTPYVQEVLVTPDFNQAENNHIPVTITLSAPKSQKHTIGIGYDTFTGPRFTAGMSLRRLTDTGQHFDAQLKLSSVVSGLAAKYYIPGKNPLTDEWLIGVNYQRFLPKEGASTSGTFTVGYVTKAKNTQTNVDMNYLVDRYKVRDLKSENTSFLYPNVNFTYSKSDDPIHPTSGKSINIVTRGTAELLLSSTSFLQSEVKTKYFYTPIDFAHLIFSANVGYTTTKNLKKLPLSIRFFAGGMNSIRGYPDSSIGPGRYLYTGSVEYQNRIKDNWWGAVFYDAGTATNHFGDKVFAGTGVGVVYTSFIGPIKFYGARTLSERKKHYAIEFSIGPEF